MDPKWTQNGPKMERKGDNMNPCTMNMKQIMNEIMNFSNPINLNPQAPIERPLSDLDDFPDEDPDEDPEYYSDCPDCRGHNALCSCDEQYEAYRERERGV
jgi:hypothetical protein